MNETISKLCQGSTDKEGAEHAFFEHPTRPSQGQDSSPDNAGADANANAGDSTIALPGLCPDELKSMQAALNAVKHDQYISQAVEGKKHSSRKKEDVTVNTVVSPSEARVEQMIAKAIDGLAAKLQKLEKFTSTPQKPTRPASLSNAGLQCFFCKKDGHIKKECKLYQSWLKKKNTNESKQESQGINNLNR